MWGMGRTHLCVWKILGFGNAFACESIHRQQDVVPEEMYSCPFFLLFCEREVPHTLSPQNRGPCYPPRFLIFASSYWKCQHYPNPHPCPNTVLVFLTLALRSIPKPARYTFRR